MFRILELQSLILTNVSHSGAPKLDFDECFALWSRTVLEELWRSAGGALESSGGDLKELWRRSGTLPRIAEFLNSSYNSKFEFPATKPNLNFDLQLQI